MSIVAIGLLLTFWWSGDIRRHSKDLFSHFLSGSWEVTTDRQSVEKLIRKSYGTSDWSIQFAAGSGQAFPLDGSLRRSTLEGLGQKSLADEANLTFISSPLPGAYGNFLADSVRDLAETLGKVNTSVFDSVALSLEDRNFLTRRERDAQTYARARKILARSPHSDALRQALDDYTDFERPIGVDFRGFPVASKPSYDRDGAWSQNAQTLPQDSRCRGTVVPLSGASTESIASNISVSPRVIEVELVRPWLSDTLLDAKVKLGGQLGRRYFDQEGSLRLIPSRLWILMEDQIDFDVSGKSDKEKVSAWSSANNCCKFTCSAVTIALAPDSLRSPSDTHFSGLVDNTTPLLFAVVSRRRIAR